MLKIEPPTLRERLLINLMPVYCVSVATSLGLYTCFLILIYPILQGSLEGLAPSGNVWIPLIFLASFASVALWSLLFWWIKKGFQRFLTFEESSASVEEGIVVMRLMKPFGAIGVLNVESIASSIVWTILRSGSIFLALGLLLSALVLASSFLAPAILAPYSIVFFYLNAVAVTPFVLGIFSSVLVLSPLEKLLACFSVMMFLPAFRIQEEQHIGKLRYFWIKQMIEKHERFLARKTLEYFQRFIRERMPALEIDPSPHFTTLALALYLEDETPMAMELLSSLRQTIRNTPDETQLAGKLLGTIFSVKEKLPRSWKTMEQGRFSIKMELKEEPRFREILKYVIGMIPPLLTLLARTA